MKRRKRNNILIVIVVLIILIFFVSKFFVNVEDETLKEDIIMKDFTNLNLSELKNYISDYDINLNIDYEYSEELDKDYIINQEFSDNVKLEDITDINLVVSLGKISKEKLESDGINELGNVPIMMYHGIVDKLSSETSYTGGNVDKDGYNRTAEAFKNDLEFYYDNGYRFIRLEDYINGKIDVPYGMSPIVLTFDDGNVNNINVTGLDEDGNIIIDKNSAVGIMEEFKKKHPDSNVTATFFVTSNLFNQPEYNEKILKFLIENGYDIGNHTKNHDNFSKIDTVKTQEVVAYVYQRLDEIIPNQYVHIIALPFGSPYNKSHSNYQYIIKGEYAGYSYETEAALRVGWEPEVSPFSNDFDKTFIKRCRAYDNNGSEFDIDMVFNSLLSKNRYISDGNVDTIVTSNSNLDSINNIYDLFVITY